MPRAAADVKETTSISSRSARRGGRLPGTAAESGLPGGSASLLRQPRGMGRERRRWRGRQVAGREAIGAWMAGSERDGSRVRDAAAYVESGCEEVDHRDTHRGVEPRCLAEAGGK